MGPSTLARQLQNKPADPPVHQSIGPTQETRMKSNHTRKLTLAALCLCAFSAMAADGAASAPGAPAAAAADAPSAYVKPNLTHAPMGELKAVVPLTTDDKKIQGMKLRNILNGMRAADEWQGHMSVRMVLYARGITLLRDPDEALRKQIDAARAKGLQILVCNNTLAENGIDFHTLYGVSDADIVPSGFAEVAYLQTQQKWVVDPAL
jgi:intracellular sulfur oxidation DsrE/DsrF family protein